MREFQKTAMALTILAAMAGLWFYTQGEHTGDQPLLLLSLDPSTIERVECENPKGSFALVRDAQGMWTISPAGDHSEAWKSNPRAVAEFFSPLEHLTAERILQAPYEREDLGLDPPLAELRCILEGKEEQLLIGKYNESSATQYLSLAGDSRLFCIARHRIAPLLVSPMALRSRKIIRVPFSKLERLSIERQGGELLFKRLEPGIFTIKDGEDELRAFPPKVEELARALESLEAIGFSELGKSKLSDFGLDPPKMHLSIDFLPPVESKAILIGNRHKDSPSVVYLKREKGDTIYHVGAEQLSLLMAGKDEWRDRSVFTIPGEAFDYVALFDCRQEPMVHVVFSKVGTRWDILRENADLRDKGKILIPQLEALRAKAYRRLPHEPLKQLGLEEPMFKLNLYAGNDPDNWFRVGRASESAQVYVLLPDNALALVDDDIIDVFSRAIEKYGEELPD